MCMGVCGCGWDARVYDAWVYGCMDAWVYGWMDARVYANGRMGIRVYGDP